MAWHLTEEEVQQALTMPIAVDEVERALKARALGQAIDIPRQRTRLATGTHINAAGSNALTRREIDEAAVRRCERVVVDSREVARNECGELLPLVERGLVHWETLAELGEIVVGRVPGRTSPRQITLYESHGMAVQDLYVAARVLALAREQGLGRELPVGM